MNRRAAIYAGLAAGTIATLAQIALWAAFTDALPSILYHDARLAAAIVMGRSVLAPPAEWDPRVMIAFGVSAAAVYRWTAGASLRNGLR